MKENDEIVLAGNNEDFTEPRTKLWFFPPTEELYGRAIWGYNRYSYPFQGGLNDQGLFIDINAVGFTGWEDDPDKPNFSGDEIEYILTRCATVEDVAHVFQTYDMYLDFVKYVVADASGDAAIIEWLDGKLHVVRKASDRDYQISTNYLSPKEHTEPRYQIAEQILTSQELPTVELMRKVLSATSYDMHFGQTLYSTVSDLKNRVFYLYHFHYFEEVVVFDLDAELKKGQASYAIPSLFKIKTQNEYFFNRMGSQQGARDLKRIIDEEGLDEGIRQFREMKDKSYDFQKYQFPEWAIKSLGMNYLTHSETGKAIGVLKLNAELHPESSEAQVVLADAYLKSGDEKSAIHHYRKALKIHPANDAVQQKLNALVE